LSATTGITKEPFNSETIADLGNHLHSFWERFKDNLKTKNTAGHALTYLKGLLQKKCRFISDQRSEMNRHLTQGFLQCHWL